jgi:hypothetical protein
LNADMQCSTSPWQCASAYSCLHLSTAGALQLVAVWPPSLQPSSHSEQQPTTTSVPTWITGWNHSASTGSCWKVSKHGWAHRWQSSLTQT